MRPTDCTMISWGKEPAGTHAYAEHYRFVFRQDATGTDFVVMVARPIYGTLNDTMMTAAQLRAQAYLEAQRFLASQQESAEQGQREYYNMPNPGG